MPFTDKMAFVKRAKDACKTVAVIVNASFVCALLFDNEMEEQFHVVSTFTFYFRPNLF